VVVISRRETRIKRVVGRDAVASESVVARMQHQADDDELVAIADYVIKNNGSLKDLERAIHTLYTEITGINARAKIR